MNEDTRTDEQRAADVAADILASLGELYRELGDLAEEIEYLNGWAGEHELLDNAITALMALRCDCLYEAVRDVASTLPIRGLDYGEPKE